MSETEGHAIESATRDCETLRRCFYVLTFVALGYSVFDCPWTAAMADPTGGTCYIRLPPSPLWSPPAPPEFSEFVQKRPSLKDLSAPPSSVEVYPELSNVFLIFALYFWPISILTSIVYSTLRSRSRDFVLDLVSSTAVSMTVSCALCILPWVLLGGWGPPAPAFFAFVGMIIGPCIGAFRQDWSGRAAELLAEKRHR